MKITIEESMGNKEDEIIIRCREVTDEILQALAMLRGEGQKVVVYQDNEIHSLHPRQIYYFEAVDNRVFAYGEKQVYTCRQKLYALEEQLAGTAFFRVSKSVLLNLRMISFLKPAFNGRLEANLHNGERVLISRSYVADLKRKLGL